MQRTKVKAKIEITSTAILGNVYIGKVNVNDRIKSAKCELTDLGNGKYKIVQFDAVLPEFKSFLDYNKIASVLNNWDKVKKIGVVEAEIDGKNYKGDEIIIDGKDVYVDGKLMLDNTASIQMQFN